jgi:hypothetical protein
MKEELRDRRYMTWRYLIALDLGYRETVNKVSSKFNVQPGTIEQDIHRMGDWITELARLDDDNGVSRLMELRENRRELQKMALRARKNGNDKRELRIRRKIDKNLEMDIKLSQSLGQTYEKPDKVEQTIRTEDTESDSYEIITDDETIEASPEAVEAVVNEKIDEAEDVSEDS